MKIAYVGNFSQPHCTEVHIALTLEDMGHQVTRIQEVPEIGRDNQWTNKVLGHDLFLYTRTWGNMVTLGDLTRLSLEGIPTASYHLDLYVGLQRESGLKDDPFWRTDYVFTPDGAESSRLVFERYGINHHYIKPGVFKKECIKLVPNNEYGLGNYVVFVGSGNYMHKEWPYRNQLLTFLKQTYKSRYSKYGNPERTIRNMQLNKLYANSNVVVGDSLCLGFDHPNYWSDRVYETLGRGGFIIHPFIEGMQDEFTDNHSIVFYKYGDFLDLKQKIDYYLDPDNDQERHEIADRGHLFVRNHATYNNRLEQALGIIFEKRDVKSGVDNMIESMKKDYGEAMLPGDGMGTIEEAVKEAMKDSDIPLKINFGAGEDQFDGYVNVDLVDVPGIDVVHNCMDFPYPFLDESADEIKAVDLVEHLDNYTDDKRPTIVAFIEECHRILKPGGVLYMQTPGWRAEFLWIDPTHVRGFDIKSFDFFDPEKEFGKTTGFYSKAKFSVKAEELENHNLRFWLTKI